MRGIVFMILAVALLSGMDALAKWLVTDGLSVIQLLFIRSSLIIPVLLIGYALTGKLSQLKPVNVKAHAARGLLGSTAPFFFFLGITYIPLTDAVVVSFASTFMITIMSMVFLGERVGIHRWASIVVGFAGVLIVATPKGDGQLIGYLLVLAGAAVYSALFVSSRYLSSTESVASLVFSYNLGVGAVSLLFMPWMWEQLETAQSLKLLGLSALAVTGHYLMTMAFKESDASLIAPLEYTALIWAIMYDLIVWHTSPSSSALTGATVIVASALYITHRERLRAAL